MKAELTDRSLHALLRSFFARRAPSDAEDLTQQTLMHALRAQSNYRGEVPVRAYVLAIARKILMTHIRQSARRPAITLEDESYPAARQERTQKQAQLGTLVARLPEELREVVELTFYREMTRVDVARSLNIPTGTVASRLRRGLAQLRETIASQGEA